MNCLDLNIPGWLFMPEREFLYSTALESPAQGLLVDIGSHAGLSACCMGMGASRRSDLLEFTLVCIEPLGTPESTAHDVTHEMLLDNLQEYVKVHTHVHIETSAEVAPQYPEESAALVFVDGDHNYDMVLQDLQLWWAKLKIGGTLACHDYDPTGTVGKALRDFFGDRELTLLPSPCALAYVVK